MASLDVYTQTDARAHSHAHTYAHINVQVVRCEYFSFQVMKVAVCVKCFKKYSRAILLCLTGECTRENYELYYIVSLNHSICHGFLGMAE